MHLEESQLRLLYATKGSWRPKPQCGLAGIGHDVTGRLYKVRRVLVTLAPIPLAPKPAKAITGTYSLPNLAAHRYVTVERGNPMLPNASYHREFNRDAAFPCGPSYPKSSTHERSRLG